MARPVRLDEKRQELLTKSIACFSRYGFSKTTLEDVAKETGINKASLYHYFKNKEELFLQVLLQVADAGIAELEAKTEKKKPPEKKLAFYFAERLHLYLQVVKLYSLNKEALLQLQATFDKSYEPIKAREVMYVAGLLKEAAPGLTKSKITYYAELLFSVADAVKHNAVYTGDLLDNSRSLTTLKDHITEAFTLLLKGINS